MNIFTDFRARIETAVAQALAALDVEVPDLSRLTVEPPREASNGDISTNAAMLLAKPLGKNPRALAELIATQFEGDEDISSANVAGPGFINLSISAHYWQNVLSTMLTKGLDYGRSDMGHGLRVNVEYVSANPTGPMHVGHCRGAVVGDALANLLACAGFEVTKEYYINDAGTQIDVLGSSVLLRYREALGEAIETIPEGLYPGDYLKPVGQTLAKAYGDKLKKMPENEALGIAKDAAIDAMMKLIRADLALLNVHHDVFFSERKLHDNNSALIQEAINDLTMKGHVYKGSVPPPKGQKPEEWEDREQMLFRSTSVGDDMDRPIAKSDGTYTYFAADIAYFKNKFDRHFDEMIYVLGADHGGYVKRLEAVARAVSDGNTKLTVLLCQLVKLYRNGEPVTMSKRAGEFITLADVVREVGRDATRFMMLFRKTDVSLDFDFAKVKEQSRDNPVFYVQYASARCHSVFRQAKEAFGWEQFDREEMKALLDLLQDDSEIALIRKLAEYPRVIETAAGVQEPHRLAFYLHDLATQFHSHWNRGGDKPELRFIKHDDGKVSLARLGLVQAVSDVLTSGLGIIGVDAPEELR